VKIGYNNCFNCDDRFELVIDEGMEMLHVDQIYLAYTQQQYGQRKTIMRNTRSAKTMLQSIARQVETELRMYKKMEGLSVLRIGAFIKALLCFQAELGDF
jgi:hypothetical protein